MENVLSLQRMQTTSAQQDMMKNSWFSISCRTAQNSSFSISC